MLIGLFVVNISFLVAVALVPGLRAWHRVHYRWYAAFAVLTAIVVVVISFQQITSQ